MFAEEPEMAAKDAPMLKGGPKFVVPEAEPEATCIEDGPSPVAAAPGILNGVAG